MPFVETECWAVEIPDEWLAECEDDVVTITDCDNVGALDITTVHKEAGVIELDDLYEFAQELINEGGEPAKITVANVDGIYFDYQEDDVAWREWYLRRGSILFYATYNVDIENVGMDDVVVDEILSTVVFFDEEKFDAANH